MILPKKIKDMEKLNNYNTYLLVLSFNPDTNGSTLLIIFK